MVFSDPHSINAYEVVRLISTIVGSGAAAMMIALLYRMGATGYMKLIVTMVWYQLIYNITFFTDGDDVGNYYVMYGSTMGKLIGGVGASVLSNWISFIVFYIVVYQQPVDIPKHYDTILTSSIIIILPVAIIYSCGDIPEDANERLQSIALDYMYNFFRLFSILVNVIILLLVLVYDCFSYCRHLSNEQIEMNTLTKQMIYFPVIQVYHTIMIS